MTQWSIWYEDASRFDGSSLEDWIKAPESGVQVVIIHELPSSPFPDKFTTGFCFNGNQRKTFFTGVDLYDPLNYGIKKKGSLISNNDYMKIWELANGND